MFKYRGTTIRLFSTKLFILVLTLSAIFAVFSLHEVVSPNYSNQRTSHRNISSGFEINPPLQTLQLHGQGLVLASVTTKADAIQNINIVPQEKRIDETLHPTLKISPNNSKSPEIRKLREIVRSVNLKESMRNKDKFGTDFSQSSLVIIIQVHDRVDYFSHLLKSLSHAKGIEKALLIISSDFYSEEINRLVEEINFCRVIHIFFPFSDQLYPNQFPGTDPNDCPRDIKKEKAKEIGCNNAETPDMFGHYREAKFTMTKHHWWWKANKVFDMLNATKSYVGPVLFLEEDYYVSPDFYHMLRLLYDRKMSGLGEDCDFITLGRYKTMDNYAMDGGHNVAELSTWRSHEHNMGLAFDRATWNKIKKCSEVFCKTYDEYNWDWSLMKISASCSSQPFKSLILKGTRVFHLGECGLHHKKKDCNIEATVQKYQSIIDRNTNSFFPSAVDIQPGNKSPSSKIGPNGGWGDSRDHALCFKLMQSDT